MDNARISLTDIEYGKHERQKVDIFIPWQIKSDSGVILFIHGGGWHQGDKAGHYHDCEHFCSLGYICATMNYRFVSEELSVFDELDDVTSALKAVKEKCAELGFNIDKAILSGGSAGSHLSLMYAYTRSSEAPVPIAAVCVYCPPVDCSKPDFLLGISGEFENWKYDILSKCCGVKLTKETFMNDEQQAALKRISPTEYVSPDVVPTAIFQGKADELIPYEHTLAFLGLLTENKIKNDLVTYENSGHALDKDPEAASEAREVFSAYAQTYLT